MISTISTQAGSAAAVLPEPLWSEPEQLEETPRRRHISAKRSWKTCRPTVNASVLINNAPIDNAPAGYWSLSPLD